MSKTVTLKGVISRMEWINPHIYVYLDVSEDNGAKNTWRLETFPPSQMRRAGLTKELLMGKPGEVVTVSILPARDGTQHLGYIERITYQDGHFNQLGFERGGTAPSTRRTVATHEDSFDERWFAVGCDDRGFLRRIA